MNSTDPNVSQQNSSPADAAGAALPPDDQVLPFQVEALGARGRIVKLGDVATRILDQHDYPEPVSRLLGEALALTAMLGASLKFDGKFILQTKTDGAVGMMVVDYATPDAMRGYAHFDPDRLAELEAAKTTAPKDLLGDGYLAMTIDQETMKDRYQGVVPLEDMTLEEAAHVYFQQSEQIPTELRLAAAPIFTAGEGDNRARWRAGGIMVQYLPDDGGVRQPDLHPGDVPEGVDIPDLALDDDRWNRAQILLKSAEDHELLDPMLSSERLLYRIYHEDGVKAFPAHELEHRCRCSRERIETMLRQFSDEERNDMIEDGAIRVTCEFCNERYDFAPGDFAPGSAPSEDS